MNIITTIKIKRRKYEITDKDMFLDNGLTTGLLMQHGRAAYLSKGDDMDLNAYHKTWLLGATEAEAERAGEDAHFENIAYLAAERAATEDTYFKNMAEYLAAREAEEAA